MQVHRLVEKVRTEKKADSRHAAAVVAKVDDDRVRVGEERHGGDGGVATELGIDEAVEFHESDVARQALNLLEAKILRGRKVAHSIAVFRRRCNRSRLDDWLH